VNKGNRYFKIVYGLMSRNNYSTACGVNMTWLSSVIVVECTVSRNNYSTACGVNNNTDDTNNVIKVSK